MTATTATKSDARRRRPRPVDRPDSPAAREQPDRIRTVTAITPNAARQRRKAEREARAEYVASVEAFRAAMAARREAKRAVDALPRLNWSVAAGLAMLVDSVRWVKVAQEAWRETPQHRAEVALGRAILAAEDACGTMAECRRWFQIRRRAVRAVDAGAVKVEMGAAWSERGLRNVQNANRSR